MALPAGGPCQRLGSTSAVASLAGSGAEPLRELGAPVAPGALGKWSFEAAGKIHGANGTAVLAEGNHAVSWCIWHGCVTAPGKREERLFSLLGTLQFPWAGYEPRRRRGWGRSAEEVVLKIWAAGLQRKAGLGAAPSLIFHIILGRLSKAASGGYRQQNTQHGEMLAEPGRSVSRQWSLWMEKLF